MIVCVQIQAKLLVYVQEAHSLGQLSGGSQL